MLYHEKVFDINGFEHLSDSCVLPPFWRYFLHIGENWGRTGALGAAWIAQALSEKRGELEPKFALFRPGPPLIHWIPPVVDQKHKVVIQMKEKKQFAELRKQYPESMNKEQFYRAAHISKATALYLLQSGLVPCTDSGKQTHRYTIRTDDVIEYLKEREMNPEKYKAREGWYADNSCCSGKMVLSAAQAKRLEAFFKRKMARFNDLLTAKDMAAFCGYCTKVIHQWCSSGELQAFQIAKQYLIPKDYAARKLASPSMYQKLTPPQPYQQLITEFRRIYKA